MTSFASEHDPGRSPRAGEPQWFACYTRARHEKKVAAVFRERGIESYLPLVTRERQWKDRRKAVEFALFPSYLFARFPADAVSQVVSVPGVVDLVRNEGRPVAVPPDELENVRRFVEALDAGEAEPEPVPLPEEGTPVRVISGPFRGVRGVVLELRSRTRVLVGLRSIGQAVAVDLDARVLEVNTSASGASR